MSTPTSSPPSDNHTLSPGEVESIKAQILTLQEDIAFMQKEDLKVRDGVLLTNGHEYTQGGYADKILSEQNQIQELQKQLP